MSGIVDRELWIHSDDCRGTGENDDRRCFHCARGFDKRSQWTDIDLLIRVRIGFGGAQVRAPRQMHNNVGAAQQLRPALRVA